MALRDLLVTGAASSSNFIFSRFLTHPGDNQFLEIISQYEPQYWALPLLTAYLNAGSIYDQTQKNSMKGKGSGLASILIAGATGIIVAGFGHMGTFEPYMYNIEN